MSGLVQCRRRLVSHLASTRIRSYRPSVFAAAAAAAGEAEPTLEAEAPVPQKKRSLLWRFLKYGCTTAIAGTAAAAGYITYAYSVDELDEKTRAFRESANTTYTPPHGDDTSSSLQKIEASIYSTVMSAPAKCIETYLDLRRSMEEQVRGFTEPVSDKLLPDLHPMDPILTLVVDLNETLICTDWKRERGWRTFKRPGVDMFLERLGPIYEIVVYSDQLDMYVEPIVERLDTKHNVRYRLYRPATKYQDGKHYRDLSKLNRDPSRIIYVSGHALENALQPENCAPIKPWKLEEGDTALIDLVPFLEFVARQNYTRPNPPDIRQVLASFKDCDIATEFNKRQREAQERQLSRRFRIW